ncbi:MAG TPA: helix-turn-helix domain-containing protein [Gaiellaceae bacterium]|nr:helix-turn-helix domain-containing protein [Gaiellaceae bacterium]
MTRERHETVGERLRRLRGERGLSQRDLAVPGVSYAHISRIERGERVPSIKALRRLARKLGVSAEFLETGADAPADQQLEVRLRDAELALRLSDGGEDAERELRRLAAEAEAAGYVDLAARAAGVLGLAALRRGDHRRAVIVLEPVAAELAPAEHPDFFGVLARSYVGVGRTEDAVALLRHALEEVEREAPENAALAVRYATLLSYALSETGDLAAARELVVHALHRAQETEDRYTRVRTHWSHARLAAVAGDTHTALASLDRAVALLEATEDERQLGRAHLLWAEILTFDGRGDEAVPHLKTAERLLGAAPDAEDLYWLRTEQARAAAQLGRAEKAIRCAREALELIGDTDPAERGAASWALGEALGQSGDLDAAAAALGEAVDLLAGQRLWREAAAAARTLVRALEDAGRGRDAAAAQARLAGELEPHVQASADAAQRLRIPQPSR